jgi:hypothetical protein
MYIPNANYLAAYAEGPGDSTDPDGDGDSDPDDSAGAGLSLGGRTKQRLDRAIEVRVACDSACTARGRGTLVAAARSLRPAAFDTRAPRKRFRLRSNRANVAAGKRKTLATQGPEKSPAHRAASPAQGRQGGSQESK